MQKLVKGKTATVQTKGGGSYKYSYADLATVNEYLDSIGKAYDQYLEPFIKDGAPVKTYIMTQKYVKDKDGNLTKDGEPMRGLPYDPPANLNIQEIGSYVSYIRRYSVYLAFGLAPADDDDGASAMPKTTAKKVAKLTENQKKIIEKYAETEFVKQTLEKNGLKIEDLDVKQASVIISKIKEKNESGNNPFGV